MPLDIVVGAQWGDEGKGRIVDLLARDADYVARYSGGDNAGHTVTVGERTFKLHLIPSGIVHGHTIGLLGNGMVIHPGRLLEEMKALQKTGIDVSPKRLRISYGAHLITPGHIALDQAEETARGARAIGTTLRGIGPAYMDKVARRGLRVGAMLAVDRFADSIRSHVEAVNRRLAQDPGAELLDSGPIVKRYLEYAAQLSPYIDDVSRTLTEALLQGGRVLAEGAQGTLLDLDHGTYPFVTSSNPTAAGALTGLGLGARPVNRVIGVTKAFQTRVGAGPFPTEAVGGIVERLRGVGERPWDEFGTTTGRPRRVGWLDTVLLRYAARVNGFTELALTKLDVLTGLDTIRICVAYRDLQRAYDQLPAGPGDLARFDPVYEELPGWHGDTGTMRGWQDLPPAAQGYVLRIAELTGVPVHLVSVGPEREQYVLAE